MSKYACDSHKSRVQEKTYDKVEQINSSRVYAIVHTIVQESTQKFKKTIHKTIIVHENQIWTATRIIHQKSLKPHLAVKFIQIKVDSSSFQTQVVPHRFDK